MTHSQSDYHITTLNKYELKRSGSERETHIYGQRNEREICLSEAMCISSAWDHICFDYSTESEHVFFQPNVSEQQKSEL